MRKNENTNSITYIHHFETLLNKKTREICFTYVK